MNHKRLLTFNQVILDFSIAIMLKFQILRKSITYTIKIMVIFHAFFTKYLEFCAFLSISWKKILIYPLKGNLKVTEICCEMYPETIFTQISSWNFFNYAYVYCKQSIEIFWRKLIQIHEELLPFEDFQEENLRIPIQIKFIF